MAKTNKLEKVGAYVAMNRANSALRTEIERDGHILKVGYNMTVEKLAEKYPSLQDFLPKHDICFISLSSLVNGLLYDAPFSPHPS
jgi:hypothetical protein